MNATQAYRSGIKDTLERMQGKVPEQTGVPEDAIQSAALNQWRQQAQTQEMILKIKTKRDSLIVRACAASTHAEYPAEGIKQMMAVVEQLNSVLADFEGK